MKKSSKIILILVLMFVIVVIAVQRRRKITGYYELSYSARYDSESVLKNKSHYEIVTDKTRLNDILIEIDNKDKETTEKFNDNFFRNSNLLVVNGGIQSELKKVDINTTQANIKIYSGSPLTSNDTVWNHELYLIPISKNVKDINVENLGYPDRVY